MHIDRWMNEWMEYELHTYVLIFFSFVICSSDFYFYYEYWFLVWWNLSMDLLRSCRFVGVLWMTKKCQNYEKIKSRYMWANNLIIYPDIAWWEYLIFAMEDQWFVNKKRKTMKINLIRFHILIQINCHPAIWFRINLLVRKIFNW